MQDDQINKSVDDLMGQSVGADSTTPQPPAGLSLGSNPSLPEPPSDMSAPAISSSDDQATPQPDEPTNEDEQPQEQKDTNDSTQSASLPPESSDELTQIKQDALAQLSPIVGELDQSPEDKYRTLMMMIQASDDKTLIKGAYEAANQIDDKKVRAEALLNIVNEINYFAGQAEQKQD